MNLKAIFTFLVCVLALGCAPENLPQNSPFCLTALGCSKEETPKLSPKQKQSDFAEKPQVAADRFTPQVDILFVIDNSGSMDFVQTSMSRNAYAFANEISKATLLDFHIGVLSTDMDSCQFGSSKENSCGKLYGTPRFISRQTPDLVSVLSQKMNIGTNGSGTERMFTPVIAALKPPLRDDVNMGFFRPNAYLAVVFISDAPDQSGLGWQTFLRQLNQIKGSPKKIFAYGVIRKYKDRNLCKSPAEPLNNQDVEMLLANVVNGDQTQKNILSLCNRNYGPKLAQFAQDIIKRSASRFTLTRLPNLDTVEVTYGRQVIPNRGFDGWTYEPATNSIVFGPDIQWQDQGEGVSIQINYDFISDETILKPKGN